MSAILTNDFSVLNTENLMTSVSTDESESNLYLTVGRGYNEKVNADKVPEGTELDDYLKWETSDIQGECSESEPPVPQDTEEYKQDFRDNITFLKQLQINDLTIMVPRYNWNAGVVYYPVNKYQNQGKRSKNYYVLSKDTTNNTLEVWLCEKNGEAYYDSTTKEWTGGNSAVTQPLLRNWPTENRVKDPETQLYKPYDFGDGIQWRFLYDISPIFQTSGKVITNWMPVPFSKFGSATGGNLTENQMNYGDVNANRVLGAHRVLVSVELSEEEYLPYSSIYRQIGIIADVLSPKPTDESGTPIVGDQSRVHGTSYSSDLVDTDSGELLYMENRSPVQRAEGQIETLQLLLVF